MKDTIFEDIERDTRTGTETRTVVVGLVNNMPDAELRNTEEQFRTLMQSASRDSGIAVQFRLFALNGVERSTNGRSDMNGRYEAVERLWDADLDGLIVTGTEPHASDLKDEPYWPSLVRLIDWSREHTNSAIWSCLAAHACVLHLDGIARTPFPGKLSGVFACDAATADGEPFAPRCWAIPHSRFNGISEAALQRGDYKILTHTREAGPDMFVKELPSLFVFLQGHPEYDAGALLREYRRDVGRYLRGKSNTHPGIPKNYFDDASLSRLLEFRERCLKLREAELLGEFPAVAPGSLMHRWQTPATSFYAGWLKHLSARRHRAKPSRPPKPQGQPETRGAQQGVPQRAPLFPALYERRYWQDFLTGQLMAASRRVNAGGPACSLDIRSFRDELTQFDFERPKPIGELLSWTITALERGIVHVTHPRYMGLFNPAPTFPAQCADRITADFNPQLASARTSPAAVAIEQHTIEAVAKRAGLTGTVGGHFTSGGSEANATALLCALTTACPQFAQDGARAFAGQPVFYISRDSHTAWLKIAHMAGIGRKAARLVPTDGKGRLDTQRLAALIEQDRLAGCMPVMIAATAGTTNAGMIDPLPECAALASDEGVWLHVDAAWGGALVASDRLRPRLAGLERASSFTLDAHKWFGATMGCGLFVTRHPALLPDVFAVSTGFMPASADALPDPYATSMQWSRRFLGLRLFLSLATAGWDGYALHVEQAVTHAALMKRLLTANGWRVVNDSPAAVLCLRPPGDAPPLRDIVRRVQDSGSAWISIAEFEGEEVIRICISNGLTTEDDVRLVAEAIHRALEECRTNPEAISYAAPT